ncbi:hypothetical protein LMG23992_00835 [Cupriavidus laharis]|uniref:Uncharacterized protein n=1 Tax=Cupriavidus laharis TaxID=151654 RepID=A0ABM8WJF9_9BURK|nr:hypothetical protein [Cupriavidus laharis]CAG9167542.1 hypothetical protein LMG23992_00835 [Cupriavidus laharis]
MLKRNLQSLLVAVVVGTGAVAVAHAQGAKPDGVHTNGGRAADPYTDGAKAGKADPYTDGAKSGKFDPYTDGAKKSTKSNLNPTNRRPDAYTDGARTGKSDPYTDGAKTGKSDPYTDGAKKP